MLKDERREKGRKYAIDDAGPKSQRESQKAAVEQLREKSVKRFDRSKNRRMQFEHVDGQFPYRESFEEDQALYDALHRVSG